MLVLFSRGMERIRMRMLKDRLFHVHIPKTAGSSVNQAFRMCEYFINGGHCFIGGGGTVVGKRVAEGPSWPSFEAKGFCKNDVVFSLVRNPWEWLLSYYNHIGYSFFGLKKHRGWAGVADWHSFSSFQDFIAAYCSEDFEWHVPRLKRSQLGQVIDHAGRAHFDFLIASERASDFIRLVRPEMAGLRINVSERPVIDYRTRYTESMAESVARKFREFNLQFGYDFEMGRRASQPMVYARTSKGVNAAVQLGLDEICLLNV